MALENNFFLRSNRVEGMTSHLCLGAPVHAQFRQIVSAIKESCGSDVAAVFAEPVLSHGSGDAAKTIAWYTSHEGFVVDYAALDESAKANARALLRKAYERLTPAFSDEIYGSSIRACFEARSQQDILLVGGKLVLINWGFRDSGDAASGQGVIARLLPDLASAPIVAEIPVALAATEPQIAAPFAAETVVLAAPAAAGHHVHTLVVPAGSDAEWRRSWIAPVLASLAVLALLVLLFGSALNWGRASAGPGDLSAFQRDINTSVEDRIAALREGLRDNVCRAPGQPAPRAPEAGRAQGGPTAPVPAPAAPAAPDAPVAPSAPNTPNAPAGGAATQPSGPENLLSRLDRATVLILSPSGMGTGFFVSPRHIVTNRHVIAGADPGKIFAISQKLPAPQHARLLAASPGNAFGDADFAVLTLERDMGEPLQIEDSADRLSQVTAAGFPFFIVKTDTGFQRLMEGDTSSVPQMAVTQGVITARQQMNMGVLAHTATISPGNSGGPLVDPCGRAVGINTFTSVDAEQQLHANFALEGKALRAFLTQNGVPFQPAASSCGPAANPGNGRS